jgi:type II secretory pathway pseudopilin PulG
MSKAPTGAIVGGVIGGIALIALLAFLIWFFLRKRKQDQTAAQILQQQADVATAAAFNNHNQVQEIAGTPKPHGAYGPPPVASIYPEKQTADSNTQEFHGPPGQQNQSTYTENVYAPGQQNQNAYRETSYGASQSPPPTYSLPPKQQQQSPISLVPSPPRNYNELEQRDDRPNSMRMPSPAPAPPGNYNEFEQRDDRPMSTHVPSELAEGEDRRISTVSPLMRQELFADHRGRYARVPQGPPPQELSASTGGINRRPVGGSGIGRQSAGFDMSGAPLGEEYTSELE